MRHRATIALAEELIARDRADDVIRMIDPLLEELPARSNGDAHEPGLVRLRLLRARLSLLEENRTETARALLEPYRSDTDRGRLDPLLTARLRTWIGWLEARTAGSGGSGSSVPAGRARRRLSRALAELRSARRTLTEHARPRAAVWTLLGEAYAYGVLGSASAAEEPLEEAELLVSQVGDRAAESWWRQIANTDPGDSGDLARRRPELTHASEAMRPIVHRIDRLRTAEEPVLLVGERGAGRGAVARTLHDRSDRPRGRWTEFEAAPALPGTGPGEPADGPLSSTWEKELSPNARDADDRGTIFLKELAGRPDRIDALLDRLVDPADETEISEAVIGSIRPERLTGEIRPVLERYFPHWIEIPPLRARNADVPILARRFLRSLQPNEAPPAVLTDRAVRTLTSYAWPGNLRQLRNELDRALAYQSGEPAPVIDRPHLAPAVRESNEHAESPGRPPEHRLGPGEDLDDALERAERACIEQALDEHDGHVASAAGRLGLTRQGLYKKMKRLNIERGRFTSSATTAN